MIEIDLLDKKTKEVCATIGIPERPNEIRLSQYIDWVTALRDSREKDENEVSTVIHAIREFSGVDISEIARARFGDENGTVTSGDVMPIYTAISQAILSFKPRLWEEGDNYIEYQGEQYCVPKTFKGALSGAISYSDLSTLEVIEILEFKRASELEAKANDGKVTASQWYSDYLRLLAFLLKKPGEDIPADGAQRDTFIKERMRLFKDIDLETALNCDFFLTSTLGGSAPPNGPIGSLMSGVLNLGMETGRLNLMSIVPKPQRKSRRSSGLVGGGSTRPLLKRGISRRLA